MAQHRWVALGSGPMTPLQAREWAGLSNLGSAESGVVSTDLAILFSSVVCAVCLGEQEDAPLDCPGPADGGRNEHLWQGFFTAAVTDDEASALADPDRKLKMPNPQSINVICVLCGDSADAAAEECRERVLWTRDSQIDLLPEDFSQGEVIRPKSEDDPTMAQGDEDGTTI